MDSLSRQQVREVDRCAIQDAGVSGVVLMENAGRQAADAIEKYLCGGEAGSAGTGARSAAIVAGAGNNGGDGFVVARHLALRGWRVATFLVAPEEKITGDAAANLRILRNLRHDVRPCAGADLARLAAQLGAFDVVVDAVGGTGIAGPLRGDAAAAVEQINASARPVAAIDIPTGLDCDSGQALGPTVRAVLTVTFVARKKGFDAPGAEAYTGRVIVADIGVPANLPARMARGRS